MKNTKKQLKKIKVTKKIWNETYLLLNQKQRSAIVNFAKCMSLTDNTQENTQENN